MKSSGPTMAAALYFIIAYRRPAKMFWFIGSLTSKAFLRSTKVIPARSLLGQSNGGRTP